MLKIEKFILSGVLLLTQLSVWGQNNTVSPYTRFGFGEIADRSFGAGRAMGGVGIGLRSPEQINPMNPASYSCMDSLTFIFDFGASMKASSFKDQANQYNHLSGNLEYIALQFPITRWLAMSAGLLPYSFVGYKFGEVSTIGDETYQNTYSGTGGLNDLYGGLSIDIWKKRLAVGANFGFLFGNINHSQYLAFSSNDNSSSSPYMNQRVRQMKVRDMKMDFGLQYTHPLSATESLIFGLTYSPSNQLGMKTYDTIEKLSVTSSGTSVIESSTDTIQGLRYDLPNSFGVGLSYMKIDKLLLAADFLYEDWSNASFMGEKTFQNRTRFAIGAQYEPNARAKNYFNRIRYRAGFHYGDSYIRVNQSEENGNKGYGYKEYGASLGLGLPLIDNRSIVNVSFEYVKVKPEHVSMIDEQYFRVTVNYTFNERWFFKFKLD